METYKFTLINISFCCIILLSLPLAFGHTKTCPVECTCSCPSGQSPPSSDQNSPPSNDQSLPPPSQELTPPSDGNQPPASQESPPESNGNQPPSQDSPPSNDQGQPPPDQDSPPGQDSPPSNDQGQPPPGQDSPPSNDQSQPPPSQDSPPSNDQSQPPPSQDSPPSNDQSQPPPGQDSPPTSQGSPPATGYSAPPQDSNSPPTGQDSSPPAQDTTPPTTPQYGQTPPSTQTPSQGSGSIGGSFSGSFNATFKGAFKRICAFGDSFTDTGNAFLSGGLKSFASGSYSSGATGQRMSNGRLVIDFLCDALDLPPLPAYKQSSANFSAGVNFATAGSTAFSADFFAKNQISHTLMWKNPLGFATQLTWFNDFIQRLACKGKSDADCRAEMEGTLFWIGEFGGNDYSRAFGSRIKFNFLQQLAIGHVCRTIMAMIARGAKYIVVQGLPPAGCCPLEMALRAKHDMDPLGCSSIGNALVKAHNALLQVKIAEFRKLHPDCMIVYADTWNAYNTILSNHKKYGFLEPFKACCGAGGGPFNFNLNLLCGAPGTSTCRNPQQFMSWDGIHMTEAMHKHLAELFFHGGFCQPSFDVLVKTKFSHHIAH